MWFYIDGKCECFLLINIFYRWICLTVNTLPYGQYRSHDENFCLLQRVPTIHHFCTHCGIALLRLFGSFCFVRASYLLLSLPNNNRQTLKNTIKDLQNFAKSGHTGARYCSRCDVLSLSLLLTQKYCCKILFFAKNFLIKMTLNKTTLSLSLSLWDTSSCIFRHAQMHSWRIFDTLFTLSPYVLLSIYFSLRLKLSFLFNSQRGFL